MKAAWTVSTYTMKQIYIHLFGYCPVNNVTSRGPTTTTGKIHWTQSVAFTKLSKKGSNETQHSGCRREYFLVSFEKGISYYSSQHCIKTWKGKEPKWRRKEQGKRRERDERHRKGKSWPKKDFGIKKVHLLWSSGCCTSSKSSYGAVQEWQDGKRVSLDYNSSNMTLN